MNIKDYNPTERFSTKAQFYKYRPDYPPEIVEILVKSINFSPDFVVADIGSGTGKLTRLFINNGNRVFAVEPNDNMRVVSEELFKDLDNYHSVNASAERTNLPSGSIDVISIGQALHWFELEKAKTEFYRILRKPGFALVLGNRPMFVNKTLSDEINAITRQFYYKGNKRINFKTIDYSQIFKPYKSKTVTMTRRVQETVLQIIYGTLSCSFSPDREDKDFQVFVDAMESILLKYLLHDKIEVDIETKMTFGRMK